MEALVRHLLVFRRNVVDFFRESDDSSKQKFSSNVPEQDIIGTDFLAPINFGRVHGKNDVHKLIRNYQR